MKIILSKECLILNKSWVPCNTVSIKRAISISIKERGKIVHPKTLNSYSFKDWISKGKEREDHETISFRDFVYDAPTIVCASYYNDIHIKYMALNHQNIYKRDGFKCAYCGKNDNLTWDHIIPESKGGKNSWTNLVTCCKTCNQKKDSMDVEEFCEIMNCEIPNPISLASTPWLLGNSNIRPEWKHFLKCKY